MSLIQRKLAKLLGMLVLLLMLAGTFTWYFQPGLLMDLSTWLATCVTP